MDQLSRSKRSTYFKHNFLPRQELKREVIDGKRYYVTPQGKKFPSVTTVLSSLTKEGINKWRKTVGEEEANKISVSAAKRGTKLHKVMEDYVNNSDNFLENATPTTKMLFSQLRPFVDEKCTEILGIEFSLFSNVLMTAGQCDLICDIEKEITVVDYKTSTRPKKEEWIKNYFLQSTCYAMMIEEQYKIEVPKIAIVIAVEEDHPQIFVKDSRAHREEVIDVFYNYHKNNPLQS